MIGFNQTARVVLLAAGLMMFNAAQAAGTFGPADPNSTTYKPSVIYVLGDIGPHGGKVYYVDNSGEHGLEAKAVDEINSLSWSDTVTAASAYGSGWHLPTKTELKDYMNKKKSWVVLLMTTIGALRCSTATVRGFKASSMVTRTATINTVSLVCVLFGFFNTFTISFMCSRRAIF